MYRDLAVQFFFLYLVHSFEQYCVRITLRSDVEALDLQIRWNTLNNEFLLLCKFCFNRQLVLIVIELNEIELYIFLGCAHDIHSEF